MDLEDVLNNIAHEPDYIWERKLNELIAKNHKFYNLSSENKELVRNLIKKHKPMIRKYGGISRLTIKDEEYHLFQNRMKLDLTEEDLKDIREILEYFKK
jgi:hypothetical protein